MLRSGKCAPEKLWVNKAAVLAASEAAPEEPVDSVENEDNSAEPVDKTDPEE